MKSEIANEDRKWGANKLSNDGAQAAPSDERNISAVVPNPLTSRQALETIVDRLEAIIIGDPRLVGLLAVAGVRVDKLLEDNRKQLLGSKYKFREVKDANPIPNRFLEGDIVTIPRYENSVMWDCPLFVRQQWVDQLLAMNSFLEHATKRTRYVDGAQGCGKTSFLWIWARSIMEQGKRVLFIQYRQACLCPIWILEDGEIKRMTAPLVGASKLLDVVEDLLNEQKRQFDVCICDGIRKDEPSSCLTGKLYANCASKGQPNGKIVKTVFETTLHYYSPSGDALMFHGTIIDTMTLDSWQVADYEKVAISDFVKNERIHNMLVTDWIRLTSGERFNQTIAAVQNGEIATELSDAEKILQAITLKWYYAGACARFMFEMNFESLWRTLQDHFDKLSPWRAFSRQGAANAPGQALMQRWSAGSNFGRLPVSRYVLLCAHKHCGAALTNEVKRAAQETKCPVLKQWLFELRQLDVIRAALETNKTTAMIQAAVGNTILTFCPQAEVSFDGNAIEGSCHVQSGFVVWCINHGNQGCPNVAFYFDSTLITIDFTVASLHSFNATCLNPLRAALLGKGIRPNRIVHVVTAEAIEHFHLDVAASNAEDAAKRGTVAAVEVATSTGLRTIASNATNWVRDINSN